MRKISLAVSPLLLLACMGATECEAFSTVTVPVVDQTPPDVYDGVWKEGVYQDLRNQDGPLVYHLAAGESVLAIASAIDQGGVKKVEMIPSYAWTCCAGNVCSNSQSLAVAIVDTQSGYPGSHVSSGIWVGTEVTLAPLPHCQSGYTLKSYSFTWQTRATNFTGKVRLGPTRRIVYP